LWDRYGLIEVCLVWGGRSIVLAQSRLEHGSATVGFDAYCPVLEQAAAVLPNNVQILFLADRGVEPGELMRWLTARGWDWAIRAKSDLLVHGQRLGGIEPHFKDYKSATFDITHSHIRHPQALVNRHKPLRPTPIPQILRHQLHKPL